MVLVLVKVPAPTTFQVTPAPDLSFETMAFSVMVWLVVTFSPPPMATARRRGGWPAQPANRMAVKQKMANFCAAVFTRFLRLVSSFECARLGLGTGAESLRREYRTAGAGTQSVCFFWGGEEAYRNETRLAAMLTLSSRQTGRAGRYRRRVGVETRFARIVWAMTLAWLGLSGRRCWGRASSDVRGFGTRLGFGKEPGPGRSARPRGVGSPGCLRWATGGSPRR